MKNSFDIKPFLVMVSLLFATQINAQHCKDTGRNTKTTRAKIAAAQLLRTAYLIAGGWHISAATISAYNTLTDQNSTLPVLLKDMAKGMLMEIAGAYCSIYTGMGLSKYIKSKKECKDSELDITEIPTEFNDDNHEDIDKVIFDIMMHSWIVASSAYYAYTVLRVPKIRTIQSVIPKDAKLTDLLSFIFLNKQPEAGIFSEHEGRIVRYLPLSIPARLYTAYHSMKTIGSKVKNLIASYKKELPKAA